MSILCLQIFFRKVSSVMYSLFKNTSLSTMPHIRIMVIQWHFLRFLISNLRFSIPLQAEKNQLFPFSTSVVAAVCRANGSGSAVLSPPSAQAVQNIAKESSAAIKLFDLFAISALLLSGKILPVYYITKTKKSIRRMTKNKNTAFAELPAKKTGMRFLPCRFYIDFIS